MAQYSDRGQQSLLQRRQSIARTACGVFLRDLLAECDELRSTAAGGRIGLSFDQIIRGAVNTRVDLGIWVAHPGEQEDHGVPFNTLLCSLGISLTSEESAVASSFPSVIVRQAQDASEMAIALDTRLVVAAQHRRLRALHAGILATNYLVKLAWPKCIMASYALVDSADHRDMATTQGSVDHIAKRAAAAAVAQRLGESLPRSVPGHPLGLDAVGTTLLTRADDSLDVVVQTSTDDTETSCVAAYPEMIRSIADAYRQRFAAVEKDPAEFVHQPAPFETSSRRHATH